MPTFKQLAYDSCKEVKKHAERQQIARTIKNLEPPMPTAEEPESDYLSFIARQEHAQVFGYLFVSERREAYIENSPVPWSIEPLDERVRKRLVGVQLFFKDLNSQCIKAALPGLDICQKAVDPYSKYPPVDLTGHKEIELLSDASKKKLARAFSNHPAAKIAPETIRSFPPEMPPIIEDGCTEAVNKMHFELLQIERPDWLTQAFTMMPPGAVQRLVIRFFFSLVTLKASLCALNQLLYQAILHDNLFVMSEENIIKIRKLSVDNSSISLDFQLQAMDYFLACGDIVLVKCNTGSYEIDQLCQIYEQKVTAASAFGDKMEVGMRGLDDFLNPFFSDLRVV